MSCDTTIEELIKYKEEVMELREWKRQAMEVMPDFQELSKLLDIPLGKDVSKHIIPKIKELKLKLSKYEQKVGELVEINFKWLIENQGWEEFQSDYSIRNGSYVLYRVSNGYDLKDTKNKRIIARGLKYHADLDEILSDL